MSQNLFQRSLAIGLAALITLATLGGVDRLAQPDQAQSQLARAATSTPLVQTVQGTLSASRS